MRVSGFVMTDESGEVLAVSVGGSGDLVKSLAAPESKKELVAEHEHLVDVLRSPDHKDDLAEADKQEAELTEYRGEAADEDLAKSHVKGYTRKDGTFVKEHDDSRQAAQPQQPVSADRVNAIHDQHNDLMHRKETEWQHNAKKIPASAVSGLPEFSHKEVYGHNRDVSPVGGDFSPEFAKQGHQGFVLRHKDGKRSFVDTQGSDYARYHAPVEDAPAGVNSDDAFEKIKAAGGTDVTTTSGHINYTHNGQQKQLAHKDAADGHRYVDSGELEQHLSDMQSSPAQKPSGRGIPKQASAADTKKAGDALRSEMEKHGAVTYDHPSVVGKVGKMTNYEWTKETGSKPVEHTGAPSNAHEFEFAGETYRPINKEATSMHDGTPVTAAETEDGHRIWVDDAGRVHADSTDEIAGLRKKYEASVAPKAEKKAAPKKAAAGGSDAGVPGKPMAKSLLFVQAGGADELLSMAKSVIGPGSGD